MAVPAGYLEGNSQHLLQEEGYREGLASRLPALSEGQSLELSI